jgi:hypothetical protein
MKKNLLVAFMFISFFGFSQNTETKYLFTNKYGIINFEIINRIKDSDSNIYSIISFQNIEYKTIIDTRIILLRKKSELKEFADKLIEFSEKEKGVEVSFKKEGKYSIDLISSSNNVVINDKEGKYNFFSKKQAKSLAQDITANIDLLKD